MKVLVTGGAGFIGSEIVAQLVERNYEVAVIDNLRNGKKENLEGYLTNIDFLEGDIRNETVMENLLEKADWVFHLACLGVRHSLHSPFENHSVNAEGTLKLLALARKKNIQRFVYISTSEVYGTARAPFITEEHPVYPLTVYGASKLAGECYARAYFESYQFPVTVLRPFNTFGPRCHHEGDSGEVIPKFMLRNLNNEPMILFGDGAQTRDFTYVKDMARNILEAGFSPKTLGKTINLGSGREISVALLAKKIAEVNEKPLNVKHVEDRPGDVRRLCADSTLAKQLFDFQNPTSLSDGLKQLKTWYLRKEETPSQLLRQEVVRNWHPSEAF